MKLYNKFVNKITVVLLVLCSFMLYTVLLFSSQDNDMFHEIISGRDLLAGNFSTASHLNNFPIIIQQWLYCIVLAIFDKLGYFGHMLCVFIQDVILYLVTALFIYNKTQDKKLSLISPFYMILFCGDYLINIRPQIITMILLVVELNILEYYKKNNKNVKYLIYLIFVMILGANFHQGIFLYHIMILGPYLYDESNKSYIDWKLFVFSPIYVLCSLCTPYGLNGALYIFNTFLSKTYKLYNINELAPITILCFVGVKLALVVIIATIMVYKRKSNMFINFYTFGIFLLSLFSTRHISILYIAILFIVCSYDFTILKLDFVKHGFTLLFALLSIVLVYNAHDIRYTYGDVANYIEDKDAKILNTAMDLGGYLEYNGCTKIYIDSRCDAFCEEISGIPNINQNLYALHHGYTIDKKLKNEFASDEFLLDIMDDYTYIVSKPLDYVNRIANENSDKWEKIFDDNSYLVYKKLK